MSIIDNLRAQAKGLEVVCDQLRAESHSTRQILVDVTEERDRWRERTQYMNSQLNDAMAEIDRIQGEYDKQWRKSKDLRAEVEALRKERDEADRRAVAAERMHADGIDSRAAAERWKIEAKREAGYDIRKSFDVVWKEILAKAKKFDAMNECQSNG